MASISLFGLLDEFLTFPSLVKWSFIMGLLGIGAMGIDKLQAVTKDDRVSERTLHLIALAGGFWGIIIGAILFHHKTSKPSFWPVNVLAMVLWVLTFLELVYGFPISR